MFINERWLGLEQLLGLSRVSLLDPKAKAAASLLIQSFSNWSDPKDPDGTVTRPARRGQWWDGLKS
jgi:hypothetical protein